MKPKNKRKRLDGRVADFYKGSQSKEGKVQWRWESKGFHKPGSNNK